MSLARIAFTNPSISSRIAASFFDLFSLVNIESELAAQQLKDKCNRTRECDTSALLAHVFPSDLYCTFLERHEFQCELFRSQRDHRIDAGRAAGWNETRRSRDRGEQRGDGEIYRRVEGVDIEENVLQ